MQAVAANYINAQMTEATYISLAKIQRNYTKHVPHIQLATIIHCDCGWAIIFFDL